VSTPRWLSLPPCATAATLHVNGAHLAVIDARPDQQTRVTAVLVPGYTGSKEDFLALLEGLTAAGHRVLAYDQRGQYESSGGHQPDAYGVDGLAADLLAVADALGEGPVHVVGHSFGGLVSRRAALERPDAFRSLTLLDSGPDALPGLRAERIRTLRPLLVGGGKDAVWQHMVAEGDGGTPLPPAVGEFVHARFHGNDEDGLRVMGDALLVEPDRVPALAGTGIPLLVAHGDADDAWSPSAQKDMAARLGARHRVITGALHSPNVEQPEQTVRVLLEFWADVDAAREAGPRDA
jgi:pimeloyl-ACP methyl ester carboxylesterase